MNITFLIGNGFDLNLGLKTTYSDFVKFYKNLDFQNEPLKSFCQNMKENEVLWSNAEIALGAYTGNLEKGKGEDFSKCHDSICEHLAKYLIEQEKRFDAEVCAEEIGQSFSKMNSIASPFPTEEKNVLNGVASAHIDESIVFNFICFNYTRTLDECLRIVKDMPEVLGTHRYRNTTFKHKIGTICHIHGTVEGEMVFGVNDESQISNIEVFECEDGDLYKNLLIKQNANATYQENTDSKAANIIKNSNLIYVYGMSIGETDKLWWSRTCDWILINPNHHLIVRDYSLPEKTVIQVNYQLAQRKTKRKISKFYNGEDAKKSTIESRIHITSDNIFDTLKDIVDSEKVRKSVLEKNVSKTLEDMFV